MIWIITADSDKQSGVVIGLQQPGDSRMEEILLFLQPAVSIINLKLS